MKKNAFILGIWDKLKKNVIVLVSTVVLTFAVASSFGQGGPPPPPPPGPGGGDKDVGGGDVPIGGGSLILISLAAFYGGKRIYSQYQKNTEEEVED